MPAYSVADAKAHLARLIDQVLLGQEVLITRHGAPVAELRATNPAARPGSSASYLWLKSRRQARKPTKRGSVDVLNIMYDPPA